METYIKFRYTLNPEVPNELGNLKKGLIENYIDILSPIKMVIGYENKNNLGDLTHPHIHIHFTTDKKIETIRKALTRKWKEDGETRTRASLYSLKQEDDVKDTDYFFRYPLKQGNTDLQEYNLYPIGYDVITQRKCAMEMYDSVVMVNRQKMEKEMNKQSTYDKLSKFLDALEIKKQEDVLRNVLKYYKQEKLSMNLNTMSGYALTYCSINDLISDEIILKKMEEKLLG